MNLCSRTHFRLRCDSRHRARFGGILLSGTMPETKENESTSELRQQAQRAESLRETLAPEAPIVARPVRRYRARIFQGYLVAATVAFGLFFFYARHSPYFSFDLPVARWVQHWHTFWL